MLIKRGQSIGLAAASITEDGDVRVEKAAYRESDINIFEIVARKIQPGLARWRDRVDKMKLFLRHQKNFIADKGQLASSTSKAPVPVNIACQ